MAYYSRQDCPRQRLRLVVPRCQDFEARKESAQEYRDQPHERLRLGQLSILVVWLNAWGSFSLTSFGNLSEGKTGTSLQVNVVREHKRTQSSKWLAREEVGLAALLVCQYLRTTALQHAGDNSRSRGIEASPQQPHARYQRGPARKGHLEICLLLSCQQFVQYLTGFEAQIFQA